VAFVAAALVPAALAVAGSVFVWLAVALDGAVLLLCLGDFLAAPRASDLSSGISNQVRLELALRGSSSRTPAFVTRIRASRAEMSKTHARSTRANR
jgi:hypothetical protein